MTKWYSINNYYAANSINYYAAVAALLLISFS